MVSENQYVTLLRKELYNEIWSISASGVSKKYSIPYTEVLRCCREADVPIPASGYWTKLRCGKQVEQIALPISTIDEVKLPRDILTKRSTKVSKDTKVTDGKVEVLQKEKLELEDITKEKDNYEQVEVNLDEPLEIENCEEKDKNIKKLGLQTSRILFLPENERDKVIKAAEEIEMTELNGKIHKKIIAYKSKIIDWNKNDNRTDGMKKALNNYSKQPPFLAGVISEETLPRVFKLLTALYIQIEKLGGSINDDLSLIIRNEHVTIEIMENQDEVKHVLTKEEARKKIIYEDEKKRHKWASEPKFRTYDYVFNGKLRIQIKKGKYFRDTDKITIEDKLGEMLIELYEESEVVRLNREAREEAARKRQEEERQREERKRLYNLEVERITALENIAKDYETACRIRNYITAIEDHNESEILNPEIESYIDWAKKKADWYDPIISRKDELFGKREHSKKEEEKVLKKQGGYWW